MRFTIETLFQIILGKKVFHETKLDQELVEELVDLGKDLPYKVVSGKTVCTDDFYEGNQSQACNLTHCYTVRPIAKPCFAN